MELSIVPLVEISILSILINYILSFLWDTRSMDLFLGLLGFLILTFISSWFKLPILQKIVYVVANVAIVAIVIIFQPELRTALSKFGVKRKRVHEHLVSNQLIEYLTQSIFRFAERHQGALVVIENQISISDFAKKGIELNAQFSSELLETLFSTHTPLHDGAVLIKDKKILAAGVILPLADESPSLRATGTRHRAALGASLETDALVIVVSEETGEVSIAKEGVLTRGIKSDRLKGILTSLFLPTLQGTPTPKKRFQFVEWLRE
jgi:diadenylate cyclase